MSGGAGAPGRLGRKGSVIWMQGLQAVIFDMDGVLVDSEAAYRRVHEAFFASQGVAVSPEEFDALAGSSRKVERQLYAQWWERSRGEQLDGEEIERREDAFWDEHPICYRDIMNPGVPETLDELRRRGYRLAVASSSPLWHIEKVLDECGIAGFFEAVESGDELHQSKPNPEIYLLTLAKLGLPAEVCCAVEDSDPGLTAARRAGLFAIAKREERFGFTQRDADVVVDGIPGVIDAVLGYGR